VRVPFTRFHRERRDGMDRRGVGEGGQQFVASGVYCSCCDFWSMEVRLVSHRRPREKSLEWTTVVHEFSTRIVVSTCFDHLPFQMSPASSVFSQR
jgi:hypothetical protein